ncbi:MAG: DUF4062 domain-containing protein [Deltaproteobacteria bacterium]|nr:DUF4062 domain-containing protein [Deltaproteobacteria bacterium]
MMPTSHSTPWRPPEWRRAHIFISSTFNDMHAERDYLVKRVFPQLQDWCERRRIRVIDVDLRWGVTEDDAIRNKNAVSVCLRRVDQCRPYFLCFLGQRYGWVPRPEDISAKTFAEFEGLRDIVNEGCSITEIEVLHAVVRPFGSSVSRDVQSHAFFYIRNPSYLEVLPHNPAYVRKIFTDEANPDSEHRSDHIARQRKLKDAVVATGQAVRTYTCSWSATSTSPENKVPLRCPSLSPSDLKRWQGLWQDSAGVTVSGCDVGESPEQEAVAKSFNTQVSKGRLTNFRVGEKAFDIVLLNDLKDAIARNFPDNAEIDDLTDFDKEMIQQEQFLFVNCEGFVERPRDFDALDTYAGDDSRHTFVLSAPSGMGKSMLLANWGDRLRSRLSTDPTASVHCRFVGASDESVTAYGLLKSLSEEFHRRGKLEGEIPFEPAELRRAWPAILADAGRTGPTVLVVDGLDHLEGGLRDLSWIPNQLPRGVKLVVSVKREHPFDSYLQSQLEARRYSLEPFTKIEHRRSLVRAYLGQYLKELDEYHVDALVRTDGAAVPLFLKVVLSELRMTTYTNLSAKIESEFGATPESAFDALLARLETDQALTDGSFTTGVVLLLGALAHTRKGLARDELVALLRDAAELKDCKERNIADFVHVVLRHLQPFLCRRDGRYDLFHESFRAAVVARYVTTDHQHIVAGKRSKQDWHRLLANYFEGLPFWNRTETPEPTKVPNRRRVEELPYHLTLAGDQTRLERTLSDLEFIEAKCVTGLVWDLVEDYDRALAAFPEQMTAQSAGHTCILLDFADFVRSRSNMFARWPALVFQEAANCEVRTPPKQIAVRRQLSGLETRPWLRHINMRSRQSRITVLSGHNMTVVAVAFDPGGSRIVSCGHDCSLRVWNLRTGEPVHVFENAITNARCMRLLPGTTRAAIGTENEGVVIWDYKTGERIRDLEGPEGGSTALSASADGTWLAVASTTKVGAGSGSYSHTIVRSDVLTGVRSTIVECTDFISAVALTKDGRFLLSGNNNGSLTLWRPGERAPLRHVKAHKTGIMPGISDLAVANDGNWVVTVSWDGYLKVWELPKLRCRFVAAAGAPIQSVTISPDDRIIVTGCLDGLVVIWNPETGESLGTLEGHDREVWCVAVASDNHHIASGDLGGTIRVVDWQRECGYQGKLRHAIVNSEIGGKRMGSFRPRLTEQLIHSMAKVRRHDSSVSHAALCSDGQHAVTSSFDGTLRIWNLRDGRNVHILEGHREPVFTFALSPNGRLIASGGRDSTLRLWDLASGAALGFCNLLGRGEPRRRKKPKSLADALLANINSSGILDVAFACDGTYLLTTDTHSSGIRLWRTDTLQPVAVLGDGSPVQALALAPDARHCALAQLGGAITIWELPAARLLLRLDGFAASSRPFGQPPALAITSIGHVVCGWHDGTIRAWDIYSDKSFVIDDNSTAGHARSIVVSDDGGIVAASRGKTTVDIWEMATGQRVRRLIFEDPHVVFALSTDGKTIASGGWNEPLTLWQIETGLRIALHPITPCCLTSRENFIVAGRQSGDVAIIEIMGFQPPSGTDLGTSEVDD